VWSEASGSFPVTPDDLGNLPLVLNAAALPGVPHREQADVFFQVVAHRYEKGSIILTSN
jgi:hypothetical protein